MTLSPSEVCSFCHEAEIPQEVPGVKHARVFAFQEFSSLTLTGHYSFAETIIISTCIMMTRQSVLAPFRLSTTRLVKPPDEPPRDNMCHHVTRANRSSEYRANDMTMTFGPYE